MLEGLISVDWTVPPSACLPGKPFASFVRGTERCGCKWMNEQFLVPAAGLTLFAQVLDRFLGLYVHLNSFVQLKRDLRAARAMC